MVCDMKTSYHRALRVLFKRLVGNDNGLNLRGETRPKHVRRYPRSTCRVDTRFCGIR